MKDFVDIKNPQSLSTGKSFDGPVTLGHLSFIGASASINNMKMSSLQNCWINTAPSTDFIEVTRKVTFEDLVTPRFQLTKGKLDEPKGKPSKKSMEFP